MDTQDQQRRGQNMNFLICMMASSGKYFINAHEVVLIRRRQVLHDKNKFTGYVKIIMYQRIKYFIEYNIYIHRV